MDHPKIVSYHKIVSYQTAYEIWIAHREIEVGKKLLADIQETMAQPGETPVDRSNRQGFQLGVPNGSGHQLLYLDAGLAQKIIEQNINLQRTKLVELGKSGSGEGLTDCAALGHESAGEAGALRTPVRGTSRQFPSGNARKRAAGMVEHCFREAGAGGSNPLTPTSISGTSA